MRTIAALTVLFLAAGCATTPRPAAPAAAPQVATAEGPCVHTATTCVALNPAVTEATIGSWLKQPGQTVKADEPIARRHVTARTRGKCVSLMVSAQAQRAGAVSDAVTPNSEIREQGQMQVRQRCFFRILDMPSAF